MKTAPIVNSPKATPLSESALTVSKMGFKRIFRRVLPKPRTKLVKETYWSLITKGTTFAIFYAFNILLARHLGLEGFGRWSFALSVTTIVSTVSFFGINKSANRFAAKYFGTPDFNTILLTSQQLRLWFSLGFTILWAVVFTVLVALQPLPVYSELIAFTPYVFLYAFVEYYKLIFQGIHRLRFFFVLSLIENFVRIIWVGVAVWLDLNLIIIVLGFSLLHVMPVLYGFLRCRKYFDPARQESARDRNRLRTRVLEYALPLLLLNLGGGLAVELDTFLLGLLSTPQEVGIYNSAKQLVAKLPHLGLALAMGIMPIFAKMNQGNAGEYLLVYKRLLKIVGWFVITIVLGVNLFSNWIIKFAYGSHFIGAVVPLKIITGYFGLFTFGVIISNFLDYRGLASKRIVWLAAFVFANVSLDLILIPKFGAVGAAAASGLAYLPYLLVVVLQAANEFKRYLK